MSRVTVIDLRSFPIIIEMDRTGVFESHHRYAPTYSEYSEWISEEIRRIRNPEQARWGRFRDSPPGSSENEQEQNGRFENRQGRILVSLHAHFYVFQLSVFEDDKWKASMLEEVELINLVKGHPHILECFASFQDQVGVVILFTLIVSI